MLLKMLVIIASVKIWQPFSDPANFGKRLNLSCYFVIHLLSHSCREVATGVVLYKDVLRNFAKFTGKHLCQCLSFNKKDTLAQAFSCEFCEILKTPFLQNTSKRLLLHKYLEFIFMTLLQLSVIFANVTNPFENSIFLFHF